MDHPWVQLSATFFGVQTPAPLGPPAPEAVLQRCSHRTSRFSAYCWTPARALTACFCGIWATYRKRPGRRRSKLPWPRLKTRRRGLLEDMSLLLEQTLDTVEDASLHFSRISPWLLTPERGEFTGELAKPPARRRVVVLGTGWGAHALTKIVDPRVSDIIVVSPRNYFVFTPMLAAASVGTVEYRSILEHIRSANPTIRFYEGKCEAVDVERHEITVRPMANAINVGGEEKVFKMAYDILAVAVGQRPDPRGTPGVRENCLFLKDIEDARSIRRRVTECFELADLPTAHVEEQQRLLTFVVIGGGPTGCELSGELSDFVRNDLRRFYPRLTSLVKIILLQRGKQILPSFGDELPAVAQDVLQSQGIEVSVESTVEAVGPKSITIRRKGSEADEVLPCGTVVWAAGNGGQDIVHNICTQLPAQLQNRAATSSQILVDDWLRVIGVKDGSMVAFGDCACIQSAHPPLPLTAQVAAQQGAYVARLINRQYDLQEGGGAPPSLPVDLGLGVLLRARWQAEAPRFNFLNLGSLAYLGEDQAVARVGLGKTTVSEAAGRAAFLLWRSVYLVKQVSFRNRVLVLFDWIKSRVFGRDLTRF